MNTAECIAGVFQLAKRAENADREQLIQSFVNVGPLLAMLNGIDHQVIFGRRGTGKTHALSYLSSSREKAGDVVALVDLRQIGSSAGMYADGNLPLAERATRLLVDTLQTIHECLLTVFITRAEELDLSRTAPALDALADAVTRVRVVGQLSTKEVVESAGEVSSTLKAGASLSPKGVGGEVGLTSSDVRKIRNQLERSTEGTEQLYLSFAEVVAAFQRIASVLEKRRMWILLDEWSSVPVALQPYLADMIRRALLPVRHTTVKVAAIEQRANFQIRNQGGDYIGIELGADMSADVNLDDFMVFENDAELSKAFFGRLIESHLRAVMPNAPEGEGSILKLVFTEKRAIEEFVRSCEGVPRDAMHILAMAAQVTATSPISVADVRKAARNWYTRDKERSASVRPGAQRLLHWIIDKVIGERKARAFLLESSVVDELVESLYDARVLHILKKGVSSHDNPGIRYNVFKLDYGCYIDLVATARAPRALLPLDDLRPDELDWGSVEVPELDYRSIRRAILSIGAFYSTP